MNIPRVCMHGYHCVCARVLGAGHNVIISRYFLYGNCQVSIVYNNTHYHTLLQPQLTIQTDDINSNS